MVSPEAPVVSPGVSPGAADPVLRPFLAAPDDAAARRHMERLIKEQVEPTANAVLRRRGMATGEEGADLLRDVVTQVALRLSTMRRPADADLAADTQTPGRAPVRDIRAYAAITAYHACDRLLREQRPARWRLANRLRYLLTHQAGLALWEEKGEPVAGYAAWQRQGKTAALDTEPALLARAALAARSGDLAELVAAAFDKAARPVPLDALVSAIAEATNLTEPRRAHAVADEDGELGAGDPYERVADPQGDVAAQAERRVYLTRFWAEIRQLPPRQCAALLLNLRDDAGRGVLALLPLLGIATLRDIAAALDMEPAAFAKIWNELPIEDAVIAEMLGATRQQVINLRKVARERLQRRMRDEK